MAQLRRRWRVVKWAGLAGLLLVGTAWAASYSRFILVWCDSGGALILFDGHLRQPFCGQRPRTLPTGVSIRRQPDLSLPALDDISLPLWLPFLIIAVPTAYLWYRDRRRLPLHCCQSCGYDLTGNKSGVCPECGGKI